MTKKNIIGKIRAGLVLKMAATEGQLTWHGEAGRPENCKISLNTNLLLRYELGHKHLSKLLVT